MTRSLDTNVLIDVLRRRNPEARSAFRKLLSQREPVVASMIVQHELLYGAALHANPLAQRESVRMVLAQLAVQPFDGRDMNVAATVRADLKRRGEPIGPYDVLVAGQALARGWSVVTGNLAEFSRIADLKVEEWTAVRS